MSWAARRFMLAIHRRCCQIMLMPSPMPPHTHLVRVYYEDTDFSGVVYHAAYLKFMERGRTEFLRGLGLQQGATHAANGLGFAVRGMQIEFLQPALMDDQLGVETIAGEVGGASLYMHQRILRGAQVLVTADVKIAVVRGGRAARLPAEIRNLLERGLP